MRVHPSNYRIIGFTGEVPSRAMAELAHAHGLWLIDDLGAGALLPLERSSDCPMNPPRASRWKRAPTLSCSARTS
jgi:seryl-tRNA(Sec) selenium transferase